MERTPGTFPNERETTYYAAHGTLIYYSELDNGAFHYIPKPYFLVGRISGPDYSPGYASVRHMGTTYPEGTAQCPRPFSRPQSLYAPDVVHFERIWRILEDTSEVAA